MKIISRAIPASRLLLLIILTVYAVRYTSSAAEGPTALGADMNSAGNTPTSLGSIEDCISVDVGETFKLDIFISNVTPVNSLAAWELNVAFDPSVVEVVDQDVQMFLAGKPGSNLITLAVPLSGGRHFLGAADIGGPAESGSGTLSQLSMRAKAAGVSLVSIPQIDIDGNGTVDLGPRLTASNSGLIGDLNGDGFFDGPTVSGAIAVGQNCSAVEIPGTPTPTTGPGPTPQPSPSADGGSPSPEFVALPADITDSGLPDSAPLPDSSSSPEFVSLPTEITDSSPAAAAAAENPPDQAADASLSQGGNPSSGDSFPLWLIVPMVLGALAVPLLITWWLRA